MDRSATLLACYLLQKEDLTAAQAIEKIREIYSLSLMSEQQEVFIAEYGTSWRKMPPRFSWVEDKTLCVMGFPDSDDNLQYLVDHNVGYLVSMTEEKDPDVSEFPELIKVDIKVQDLTAPSQHQVNDFLAVMDTAGMENQAVALHCYGGRGRTGTMVACYFVQTQGLTAAQALAKTRQLRPGSVETTDQELAIYDFEKSIRQNVELLDIKVL